MRTPLVAIACTLAAALPLAVSSTATAQSRDGFDINRYGAPPTLDDGLVLQRSDTLRHLAVSAQLSFDMARGLLVLSDRNNSSESEDLVSTSMHAYANLAMGLGDRFEISAALPVTLAQLGSDAMDVNGVPFSSPDGASLGDAAFGGSYSIVESEEFGPSIGVSSFITVPSGSAADFSGDGSTGLIVNALGSWKFGQLVAASSVGLRYRSFREFEEANVGSQLLLRAGVHYELKKTRLMAEFDGATGLGADSIARGASTPGELLFGARHKLPGGFEASAGLGLGIGKAVGVPSTRLLAALGWTSPAPKAPGPLVQPLAAPVAVAKAPEPDSDRDDDGITNEEDACPEEAEDIDNYEDEDGCPEIDNDGDGIVDSEDPCPLMAETAVDADNYDGCPELERVVSVTDSSPDLPEPIQFKFRSAELLPTSYPKLQLIADVLSDNEQLKLIAIQGHTSSEGSEGFNKALSEMRAAAVVDALIERGVSPERLRAHGYGPSKPVADNETEAGRIRNRRVEYVIVEMN